MKFEKTGVRHNKPKDNWPWILWSTKTGLSHFLRHPEFGAVDEAYPKKVCCAQSQSHSPRSGNCLVPSISG